jgi:acyl-CoA synthetase (AMP-forming)/AMP-acid ligase II
MEQPEHAVDTLVDLLLARAAREPKTRVMTFLERGEDETAALRFGQIDARARALAVRLRSLASPESRALLFFKPGLDFVTGYWGSLYAGMIAVPVPSPGVRALESLPRLRAVSEDCGAELLLTTADMVEHVQEMLEGDDALGRLQVVAVDAVDPALAAEWRRPPIEGCAVAHLQYSSGSTGAPKGVVLTHRNALANLALIYQSGGGYRDGDGGVTWLPMFHDMGLVTTVLLPVYGGGPVWYMSPLAFLQRPLRWLQAISALRATRSAAPNFALDLCVERVDEAERALLDLSSMRVLTIGSEPIRTGSLRRFVDAFSVCGFDSRSFFPSYGLAEATLQVTGGPVDQGTTEIEVDAAELAAGRAVRANGGPSHQLAASGAAPPSADVRVVDPENLEPLAEGHVGEIVVAGESVARRYWNDEDASLRTFDVTVDGARGFMRTGDLGFMWGDQLFVTGRIKDMVIVNGQNHYPHDLELTASDSHPALRPERCVAFSVDDEAGERLVVVVQPDRREMKPREHDDPARDRRQELVDAVRAAVAAGHGVAVGEVLIVRRVPLTSSGKPRRGECRRQYLDGVFEDHRAREVARG